MKRIAVKVSSYMKWIAGAGLLLLSIIFGNPALAQSAPALTNDQIKQICTPTPSGAPALADRMPELSADQMTEAEKQGQTDFAKIRGGSEGHGKVFGPYIDLLRSPEVLLPTVQLGTYLQFHSVLPDKLRQFDTAITARQWSQEYMWGVHCSASLKDGVSPEVIKALAEGRRPSEMAEDEAIVYDFLDELHRNQSVSDTTYNKAAAKFGEQGVIEMIAINGYYTYLAMVLNATRHPVNKNASPGLPLFPH